MKVLPYNPSLRDRWGVRARIAGGAVIGLVLLASLLAGLWIRQWTWQVTEHIHWERNARNALTWGQRVLDGVDPANRGTGAATWAQAWRGYWPHYDELAAHPEWVRERVDYAPLRLMVAVAWAKTARAAAGGGYVEWEPDQTYFMLRLNKIMELAAAVAAGLVAHHWAKRGGRSPEASLIAGIVAGLLLWFNVAVILEAHGWPQWDIWAIPFYLLAVYAASRNAWMTAGVFVGIGALLKGQIMFAAPVLLLWALFSGRPIAALRMVIGIAWPVTIVTLPWLLRGALPWTIVLLVAAAAIAVSVRWGRRAVSGTWLATIVRLSSAVTVLTIVMVVASWRGNFTWFVAGYMTGTEKFPLLARNAGSNLGAILEQRYGWKYGDILFGDWTINQFMLTLFIASVVICGVGATIHARRNSSRFVAAIVAPWVLSFALMPQMDGRYLLYGASTAAVFTCLGVGPVLLQLALTAMNFCMMLKFMLARFPTYWPAWTDFLRGIEPDMGWGVLMAAAVTLYLAVMPERQTLVEPVATVKPIEPVEPVVTPRVAPASL